MKYKTLLGFIGILFVLGLVGCGGETAVVTHEALLAQIPSLYSDDARQANGTFVGAVAGSEYFVGLVIQGEMVVGYLCNGEDVGDWLRGTATDGQLDLSSSGGTKLVGTLSGGVVSGTVTVGGEQPLAFTAAPAQESLTGFYRHTESVNGTNVVAGWVMLENGIVGTSSDGDKLAIRDTITGKSEEGGGTSSSNSGSDAVDTKGVEERPAVEVTPGGDNGEEITTLGEAPPPSCETTREGCGDSTTNCDALRSNLSAAERALGNLESELAQNGVQNVRDHPAISAAQRSISNLSGQLGSSGCG